MKQMNQQFKLQDTFADNQVGRDKNLMKAQGNQDRKNISAQGKQDRLGIQGQLKVSKDQDWAFKPKANKTGLGWLLRVSRTG